MAGATPEGVATTGPGYALYRFGAYPAMTEAEQGSVQGEVYLVTEEHRGRLDAFEGCPELYHRARVRLADGSSAEAYLVRRDRVIGCARIGGGNWHEETR